MDVKKKKNKKKKGNNQSKVTDDVPSSAEQVVIREEDNGSAQQQQVHLPQVSSLADIQSIGVSESDVEPDRHKVYEEKLVKLQDEVRRLEDQKSGWLQKEARLDEKIKLLQNDVDSCIKKGANLEEKLKILESINDSFVQKEASLEDRVKHIEGIRDSWNLKETLSGMDSKLDEVTLRLQEQVKELHESRDCLVQENTQLKEIIAVMQSRIQHIETEVFLSRSSNVMVTKLPEEKDSGFQSEATPQPLLEKLDQDKTELVEGREVHIESDQMQHAATTAAQLPRTTEFNHVKESSHSAIPMNKHEPEYGAEMNESGEGLPSLARDHEPAIAMNKYKSEFGGEMNESGEEISSMARDHDPFSIITNGVERIDTHNRVQQEQLIGMDDSRIGEDIVLVPLDDDIHVAEPEKPQTEKDGEDSSLPLSDAPLIGAPFRLISFFAKYVSGADLVQHDRPTSG